MRVTIAVLVGSTFLMACGVPRDQGSDEPGEANHDIVEEETQRRFNYEQLSGVGPAMLESSLCELVGRSVAGGVFEVTEILGVTEEVPEGSGEFAPRIYVTLDRVEDWFGETEQEIVVRVPGGPVDDLFLMPPISLRLNETALFLLEEPRVDFGGMHVLYYGPQIFRENEEGRFTNGMHFSREGAGLEDVRELVELIHASSEECPIDERTGLRERTPDVEPSNHSEDEEDDRIVEDDGL